jgi:hypothetical protein
MRDIWDAGYGMRDLGSGTKFGEACRAETDAGVLVFEFFDDEGGINAEHTE